MYVHVSRTIVGQDIVHFCNSNVPSGGLSPLITTCHSLYLCGMNSTQAKVTKDMSPEGP